MIFLSVGTFHLGFNELVKATDESCGTLSFEGFAQIGASRVIPKNMEWARFIPANEMTKYIKTAKLNICHGGLGIIGDIMRAQKPMVVVPRQQKIGSNNPANDQRFITRHLGKIYPIYVCEDLRDLTWIIKKILEHPKESITYEINTNIPKLIQEYLQTH
jgi:UDP-N-acetylglucosamine transferase subunit ALG13